MSFSTAVQASIDHDSGQLDTANLNRRMNEYIMQGLDADAKANNWTKGEYDQAAKERFDAYNNFLKNELMEQTYGIGNTTGEIIDGTKKAASKGVDALIDYGQKFGGKGGGD